MKTHAEIYGTTANPCPDWCTLDPGHGYDCGDNREMHRSHEREIGWLQGPSIGAAYASVSVYVALASLEALRTTDDGMDVVEVDPPHIVMDANDNNMGSDQAREVARMLLEAADKLDQVTGRRA